MAILSPPFGASDIEKMCMHKTRRQDSAGSSSDQQTATSDQAPLGPIYEVLWLPYLTLVTIVRSTK